MSDTVSGTLNWYEDEDGEIRCARCDAVIPVMYAVLAHLFCKPAEDTEDTDDRH